MLVSNQIHRSILSNWVLAIFTLILLIATFVSDFFQAPTLTSHKLAKYRHLFTAEDIGATNKVILKTRLGTFQLTKNNLATNNNWELEFPRKISANTDAVNKIFSILEKIKINKIYPNDPINISNFSLNNPIMEISIFHNDEVQSMKLGLINPLDNSAYVFSSKQNFIYHIYDLDSYIEKLDLSDLIDSKVFAVDLDKITSFKIYRGELKNNDILLECHYVHNKWTGKNGQSLNDEKTIEYLKQLTSLKSQIIIDKKNQILEVALRQYMNNPQYTVIFQDIYSNTYTYLISQIITELPNIKMERKQNILIAASNRDYPYLINKNYLDLFYKGQKDLQIFY